LRHNELSISFHSTDNQLETQDIIKMLRLFTSESAQVIINNLIHHTTMKTILVPTKEKLNPASQSILEVVQSKMGKIPNLYATIGYSSSALKAMLDTEAALSIDSSFSAKEREAISLIVSQVNDCDYCLAAHTVLGKMRGYTEEDTVLIRNAQFTDEKMNTVLLLAQSIANNKGNAEQAALDHFFDAGYDEKALVELIALISLRSFANYVFANTKIPVDFPKAPAL